MRTEKAPVVTEGAMGTPGFSIRRRLDGGYSLARRTASASTITPDAFRYCAPSGPPSARSIAI